MMNCNAPDVPYEQLAKPAPVRIHSGPRQSKADKKAAKRSRHQIQLLSLLALAETRRQILDLLQNAGAYDWQYCSGGRLVLPLNDDSALHVHSPASATDKPTDVLGLSISRSGYVVNGRIEQQLYLEQTGGEIVMSQTFLSGRGSVGSPARACLVKDEQSIAVPGQTLPCASGSIARQTASEGACVIVRYNQVTGFMGRTFWPLGEDPVREQVAQATADQVRAIVGAALAAWSDQ